MDSAAPKEKEREKEREMEIEAALYTNCLLLGLNPTVLGPNRIGRFRHSNPKLGETLLHFIFNALRGPVQSAKDFANVWPICDASQSRDFRKIVQALINELEFQGAVPRSNSRVSSLATCCGQRFVELLWQLSAHALREVHKRMFPDDASTNPLPASLAEVMNQSSYASALLPIIKARITLERRQFLKSAASAVWRQSLWSSLAHDMTSEFRSLCADEAYFQQEIEKVEEQQELEKAENVNKCNVKSDDDAQEGSSLVDLNNMNISRISNIWGSLLDHLTNHEELSSGPIEDLISHREHRYCISGSTLRVALDHNYGFSQLNPSSTVDRMEIVTNHFGDANKALQNVTPDMEATIWKNETGRGNGFSYLTEKKCGKLSPPIDVAEILRRWTHALQRLHKQSLQLGRSNVGKGPTFLRHGSDSGSNAHIQSLQSSLAEHEQHLANIESFSCQLKDVIPKIKSSISRLREEVDKAAATNPSFKPQRHFASPYECQHFDKDNIVSALVRRPETFTGDSEANNISAGMQRYCDDPTLEISLLRQSVRNAALANLAVPSAPGDENVNQCNEHYFMPVSSVNFFPNSEDEMLPRYEKWLSSLDTSDSKQDVCYGGHDKKSITSESKTTSGCGSKACVKGPSRTNILEDSEFDFDNIRDELVRPFSPPLLMELSSFPEAYDNLLAPMTEGDAALMECSMQTMHT